MLFIKKLYIKTHSS